jgi:hypothetical protein
MTIRAESDAEFINRISELLFGYREASNEEIYSQIVILQEFKENVAISRTAKKNAKKLQRLARELAKIVDEAE